MSNSNFNRRNFLKVAAAAPAAGLGLGVIGTAQKATAGGHGGGHVVVIGGGFGGATAAKYVRKFDDSIKVTLIEGNKEYTTCPGSNWVIAGERDLSSITFNYDGLKKHGVEVINDWVTGIDASAKTVKLKGGDSVKYDRLIVSPGIELQGNVEGYTADSYEKVPHAWKAGPQTALLRDQLHAMEDGGTVIIAPPPNPFRCPPGPPERISMMANYLQKNKPKSKILVLDAKDKFSKQGLFIQGWEKLYGYGTDNSMIEWVPASKGGTVKSIDVANMTVTAGDMDETHKGDVINIIPAQKAGTIAKEAGLTDDSGWCPVNHQTWESTQHENIHVIGDAAIQSPLPKSGYAANSEAKVCAANVVALMKEKDPVDPSWVNTCYSLVGPDYGISVAMVYNMVDGKVAKVEGSGGLSAKDDMAMRPMESVFAQAWYTSITNDIFG